MPRNITPELNARIKSALPKPALVLDDLVITDVLAGSPADQMKADMEKDAINRGEDVGEEA